MSQEVLQFRVIVLFTAAAMLLIACSGTVSEREAGGQSAMSDEDFISWIQRVIDYQISPEDAMNNIPEVRGKVVKWHGKIIKMWENKMQICGRMILKRPLDGSPIPDDVDLDDPRAYDYYENFLIILDHPLPRETHIGDKTQTVAVWDAVYVIGEIVDKQAIVTESGNKLTLPVLQGYIISKENDRNFENPVWVGQR